MKRIGWLEILQQAPASCRALVVDDEVAVRQGLERLLTRFGHTVRTAASSEEADAWMSAERFDVCLLDIELPRMKGVEFLRWALGRDPEMAVIMLTGLDDPQLAVACLEAGARTYLVKPVEGEILRVALRDALALRSVLLERNQLAVGI